MKAMLIAAQSRVNSGSRKSKTGYFWALARDGQPWAGCAARGRFQCSRS